MSDAVSVDSLPAALTGEGDRSADDQRPDGLPDYLALITAEMEAIDARRAAEAMSHPVSRGTPRTSGGSSSRMRYANASSLGAGELILTARELTGLTQLQLAARAATSQSAISLMESGNRLPSLRTLIRVAEAAGFELVAGLRTPGAIQLSVIGALIASDEDELADFVPIEPRAEPPPQPP